jgi:hypothetical protein
MANFGRSVIGGNFVGGDYDFQIWGDGAGDFFIAASLAAKRFDFVADHFDEGSDRKHFLACPARSRSALGADGFFNRVLFVFLSLMKACRSQ